MLTSERIEYAVIGAMAASIYGVVRASIDADAVLSLAPQNNPIWRKPFEMRAFRRSCGWEMQTIRYPPYCT